MAARKTTRKKSARRKTKLSKRGARLIDSIEKELADLSKSIDKRMGPLRKEIEKAERQAGSGGARLLREARRKLNQLEIKGHTDWNQFLRRSRRDLSKALTEFEQSVRPKRKTAKKKTKKKKAKKKTARKKAARRR